MSALELCILSAPEGFTAAVATMNEMGAADSVLAQLSLAVLRFLDQRHGSLNASEFSSQFRAGGVDVDEKATQSVTNALSYLYRGAVTAGVNGAGVKAACEKHTDMEAVVVGAVSGAFDVWSATKSARDSESKGSEAGDAPAAAARTLSVGEVVGLDWRVGVALQSSACSDLSSPFVTLKLKVANSDGHVTAYPLELTVPEFNTFAETLREMSGALDRL